MDFYRLISLAGIPFLLGIAYLLSNNRKRIRYRTVGFGLSLQLVFALIILKTAPGRIIFELASDFVNQILRFTDAGAAMVFGNLYLGTDGIVSSLKSMPSMRSIDPSMGTIQVINSSGGQFVELGTVFAFHVLPTIIFFSSLISILYHLGVMQRIVELLARVMTRTMGTSGAESLSNASNIFVGQTEAPLVIRPFVKDATVSELMAIMVGGFATIAGGVMAAYVRFGVNAGHLMAASVMSAPAALMIAKILYPETEHPKTDAHTKLSREKATSNVIDAAALGARDGLFLALNVAGMLIAFIALVAMLNFILGKTDELLNLFTFYQFDFQFDLSLSTVFTLVFTPFAFFMGVPFQDIPSMANLLGTKIAINEFVAYVDLAKVKDMITPRTFTIATYALCGFANFSSIAIQIGGISSLAPERRSDLASIGLKAMFGGAIASWITACIAGVLI
ncbi:MAG: NupC/NupG family nucleoside CNT transporter [Candidatus Delongbacteria bacterium]|nr:NupC/NupG family nucleoside CNT transporter [Candidatus Delongbacteria bacterium]